MPNDLFSDVVARPSFVRTRRSPLVVVSLSAHVALVVGFVAASMVAPGALPFPTQAIAWWKPVPVKLVDIPLPPKPGPKDPRPNHSSSNRSAAPDAPLPVVTAPGHIAPYTESSSGIGRGRTVPTDDIGTLMGSGLTTAEPAPLPPAPKQPVRLHSGIRAPRKVVDVPPVYPELARRIRQEGIVILEATIDERGLVQNTSVLRSVPYLDQAAVDAVRQWRFEPARLNDQPLPVIMTITVRFTLS